MNKLYRDTVTLYHADAAAQTVVRTVLRGVCWQQGRRELPDAGGTRRGTALLVVIPEMTARYGADYTLAPGDRLFPGEGPALTWADWPALCLRRWRVRRWCSTCCRCGCAVNRTMSRPVPGGTEAERA